MGNTTIAQDFEQQQQKLEQQIAAAKQKHPEIEPWIFDQMVAEQRKILPEYNKKMEKLQRPTREGIPPDQRYVANEMAKFSDTLRQQVLTNVTDEYKKRHHGATPADINQQVGGAWGAVVKERDGPGILETVTNQFYNKEKGGLQMGGVLGAVAGFLGMFMLTGGGGQGIVGLLALALFTGLGAWAGNKVTDHLNATPGGASAKGGAGNSPAAGKGVEQPQTGQDLGNIVKPENYACYPSANGDCVTPPNVPQNAGGSTSKSASH